MRHVTRRQALIAASLGGALVAAVQPTSAQSADQPAMQAALDSLRAAEKQLKLGTSDKGGHRVKALQLVKNAITEVQKGIEYDRKH